MINYQPNCIEFVTIGIQGRGADGCERGVWGTYCEANEEGLEREREVRALQVDGMAGVKIRKRDRCFGGTMS